MMLLTITVMVDCVICICMKSRISPLKFLGVWGKKNKVEIKFFLDLFFEILDFHIIY
jgi:hypothetical protein